MTEPFHDPQSLGKLSRVDPRTVWRNEAHDFTPWLAENLALLNEALGVEIELTGTEKAVGDFAVDIYGREVGSGHEVIIENQLAPTDHGHLGQLLTYASGLDAKIVVWISPEFRDEHRQALDWLNGQTTEGISFFGVELELLKIDDCLPAPNFKLVAQPSEWQKAVRGHGVGGSPGISAKAQRYHDFFELFLHKLKERHPGFTNINRVGYDNWVHFATGRYGFAFSTSFTSGNKFRVELEIDTGDYDKNRKAFDQLAMDKDVLTESLGDLVWDFVEGRRAQRIFLVKDGSLETAEQDIGGFHEWALERLVKFKAEFSPRIKDLNLG